MKKKIIISILILSILLLLTIFLLLEATVYAEIKCIVYASKKGDFVGATAMPDINVYKIYNFGKIKVYRETYKSPDEDNLELYKSGNLSRTQIKEVKNIISECKTNELTEDDDYTDVYVYYNNMEYRLTATDFYKINKIIKYNLK